MTQELVIKFLQRKREVDFTSLYREFDAKSVNSRKALKYIIEKLQAEERIFMNPRTLKIYYGKKKDNPDKRASRPPRFSKDDTPRVQYEGAEKDLILIKEKHQLPNDFPVAIEQELKNNVWENSPSLERHREDLRSLFVITIDGADSKDLDDAVSISKSLFGTWELGVHIADVSYYVPQHTVLDTEAYARANSYYFINKVTPMLPQTLSNDLCSLNPNEEKKAMSIFIKFDNKGQVKGYRITPSLIKTSHRMTYDRVEEIIKTGEEKDSTLLKNVKLMDNLFRILHNKRIVNGSVDFSFKEKKIVLDDNDEPTKIYQKERQDSERLIEEFMLAANQAAGDFLSKKGLGLYRVHDIPPSEKYLKLKNFAAKRGYVLPEVPTPKDMQKFIDSLEGSPLKMSGEILTLRSMAQAVYQQENIGHFGLGFELYAHFTSPIRRYADLVVHRLIKYYLFKDEFNKAPYTTTELDKIGTHISAQERIAMEAERDLYKIKSVRYIKPMEGEIVKGMISSVAHFGIFIEMENSGVEAMIRYTDMKDYITFDEDELMAYNRKKTKIYKLGMPITVRIAKVNIERGFIDAEEITE